MIVHGKRMLFWSAWVVLLGPGSAQDTTKTRKGDQPGDGLIARVAHLMPPAFAADLNLTADQRSQIQKLDQEFKQKRREALTSTAVKVMAVVQSLEDEDEGELAPVLAIAHEITGGLLESRRSRMAYEQKMLGLLDNRQKAQFARLKDLGPRERRQQRLADGSEESEVVPAPFGRQLEQLRLTDDQKQKSAELRREMESRFRDLLTAEQKRRLDGGKRD